MIPASHRRCKLYPNDRPMTMIPKDKSSLLKLRFHLLAAFGAENRSQVIRIHDRLTGKVDIKNAFFRIAAGFVVTVKPVGVGAVGIGWQRLHFLAALGTENSGHIVAVHHGLLGHFQNERALASLDAGITVAEKSV
jgi:hypothetical protein